MEGLGQGRSPGGGVATANNVIHAAPQRHSNLVHDGLDVQTVAQISGTSVLMIERHDGHLRSEVAAKALAGLAI